MSFEKFATYREIKSQTEAWAQALDVICKRTTSKSRRITTRSSSPGAAQRIISR